MRKQALSLVGKSGVPPPLVQSPKDSASSSGSTAKRVAAKNAYTDEEELILVKICDWAKCFRWMHEQAYNVYWWIHVCFMVPVIILSTVAGTGNFALSKFSGEDAMTAAMVIGVLSLVAGMMSTILQFLKVVENLEAYRQAFLSWGQMARDIEYELAKAPAKRQPSLDFMEKIATDYNRLAEISPVIPDRVKARFHRLMATSGDPQLMLPDICGGLRHTTRFGDDQMFEVSPLSNEGAADTTHLSLEMLEESKEIQRKEEFARIEFYSEHGRYPSADELVKTIQSK